MEIHIIATKYQAIIDHEMKQCHKLLEPINQEIQKIRYDKDPLKQIRLTGLLDRKDIIITYYNKTIDYILYKLDQETSKIIFRIPIKFFA